MEQYDIPTAGNKLQRIGKIPPILATENKEAVLICAASLPQKLNSAYIHLS